MTEFMLGLLLVVGLYVLVAAAVSYVATQPLRKRLDWLEWEAHRLAREVVRLKDGTALAGGPGAAAPMSSAAAAVAPTAISDFLLPQSSPPAPAASVPQAAVAPARLPATPPPVSRPPAAPPAPAKPLLSPEERLGQWLGWLAAVTVVLTVAFFLKWTYDMGWLARIPAWAYVSMGWLGGAALLGAGERFRRALPLYAQGLTGAGIAILYLTTYAGHNYDVLAAGPATAGLVLVGGLALGLALRHESQAIGWIGVAPG